MARYIDADALIKKGWRLERHAPSGAVISEMSIADVPTAEVVEVRHGEWIDRDDKTWCSLCDKSNKQYKPPFCPHCGAKMDGKGKNELFENPEQLDLRPFSCGDENGGEVTE